MPRRSFAEAAGRTCVELKLRQANIRVLTLPERSATPGPSYLYLRIGTVKNRVGIYGYHIALELRQLVRLTREACMTSWAGTWESGGQEELLRQSAPTRCPTRYEREREMSSSYFSMPTRRPTQSGGNGGSRQTRTRGIV